MSPGTVVLLIVWSILATLAALFFALDGSRKSMAAGLADVENHDLRTRVAELTAEVRRLREASGMTTDIAPPSPADELMPLRTANHGAKPARPPRKDASGTVAFISSDGAERKRIATAAASAGYNVVPVEFGDATRVVHELTTAALVLDLRDTEIATNASALLESFAGDALAREVPVFALIKSASERERLLEDTHITAAFVTPTDGALFTSTLGAAVIRRRTRARRAEAARSVSSFARS